MQQALRIGEVQEIEPWRSIASGRTVRLPEMIQSTGERPRRSLVGLLVFCLGGTATGVGLMLALLGPADPLLASGLVLALLGAATAYLGRFFARLLDAQAVEFQGLDPVDRDDP